MIPFAWLDRILEWFTPDHLKNDVGMRKRVRMFLISHIFGPMASCPIPISLYIMDPSPWPQVPILAASIQGFWVFLVLIKLFPRHYTALALISILNLNFAVLWASFNYGGTSSPFLVWYVMLPMLAFFYLGATALTRTLILLQVVLGIAVFLAAYILSGQAFPSNIPISELVYVGMVSEVCATFYVFFMASYYAKVVDSQSELMKEIARHEGTLVELTASKEWTEQARNLAELRNAELEVTRASLEHHALHDALTKLPNRRYLDQVLAQHGDDCAQCGDSIALLQVDLDHFKQINDTFGHVAGDEILVQVAHLLRSSVPEDDFVARVGGDEFIIVSRMRAVDLEALETKARVLIEKLRKPMYYQDQTCRFGASIGIAVETGSKVSAQSLLVNSDIALYRAKQSNRGRSEFYSEALQLELLANKRLADDILRGIEQKEFISYYQPQFDARNHGVVGVEALVRWNHPTRGVLTPDHFLKVAEEINALNSIDGMILEEAIRNHRRWSQMALDVPRVAVNVSTSRLADLDLVNNLRAMDLEPGAITFELVESIFLDDTEEVFAHNIDMIKALGIDIEIDDFGTGHASIISLLKLSPKRLKIDRQFVSPIVHSPEKRKLVSSIIDMGKSLGIEVVAEGVEDMAQATILAGLGCDIFQGYAFARPMPREQLESFMALQPRMMAAS